MLAVGKQTLLKNFPMLPLRVIQSVRSAYLFCVWEAKAVNRTTIWREKHFKLVWRLCCGQSIVLAYCDVYLSAPLTVNGRIQANSAACHISLIVPILSIFAIKLILISGMTQNEMCMNWKKIQTEPKFFQIR